ncbi:hypothetical protein KUCAC02_030557 [Chaenocephalus aceratus]|uniref:Uncharacterized protein n=1 Tax=Chaenocephalus aceratus TaxID=36190 RepID=A0ACB9XJ81_CHAAC|nr:hypothetical protein KUCAC02_030557 [Chaenocephalus aceratus]
MFIIKTVLLLLIAASSPTKTTSDKCPHPATAESWFPVEGSSLPVLWLLLIHRLSTPGGKTTYFRPFE